MRLGSSIRRAREAKGLSTTQLAFHLNRATQTIVAYENGTITPPIPVVQLMAEILDVSIDALIADVEFSEGGGGS